MEDWKKADKCPHCGGRMTMSEHFAYTHDYPVRKDGKLCKKFRKSEGGPIDCITAFCYSCHAYWDGANTIMDGDVLYIRGKGTRAYGL